MLRGRLLRGVMVFAISVICWSARAQQDYDKTTQSIIEQRIEVLAEAFEDDDLDYTVIFDQLLFFYEHPLNLNRATSEDLASLFLLDAIQINNLKRHIARFGELLDLAELQVIPGFTSETVRLIAPFVTVGMSTGGKFSWKELRREGRSDLIIRLHRELQERKGFRSFDDEDPAFMGDQNRIFTRYRFQYKNMLSIGFTAEKDPGETYLVNGMPDFYSYHLFYRNKGTVRSVALGDYQVQFGQGLTMWSGLGFGKTLNITNVKRVAPGLRPYTSVDENRFLRGAAVELGHKRWTTLLFASSKAIDANLQASADTTDAEEAFFSSLQFSGFHRTPSELTNKNSIKEQIAGGRMGYKHKRFTAGLGGYYLRYNVPFNRDLRPYQRFDLDTNRNAVIGADFAWNFRNAHFFGEASTSINGGKAALAGVLAAIDPKLSLSVIWRHYEPEFQNLLGNAFGENTRNANEQGVYAGFSFKPDRKRELLGYADFIRFPWMRYLADGPSVARDYMVQFNLTPRRRHLYYIRARWRDRSRNSMENEGPLHIPVDMVRTQLRFHAEYPASPSIRLKSRLEFSTFELESRKEVGVLMYQDLIWSPMGSSWSISARYALFDTPSYDTRMYAFENDVLFSYSIPAYYGRGSRAYLMARWKASRNLSFWIRYGDRLFLDRKVISSGNMEIEGNRQSDLKLQMRYRF
jgi:hypothetical protein